MLKQSIQYYTTHLADLSLTGNALPEQETVISIMRNSDIAVIETTDPTIFTKLRKKSLSNPEEWKLDDVTTAPGSHPNDITSATFVCPKKYVSFRTKSVEREISDEDRAIMADRLRVLRTKKEED